MVGMRTSGAPLAILISNGLNLKVSIVHNVKFYYMKRINIVNFTKGNSLFYYGMKPSFWSLKNNQKSGQGWFHGSARSRCHRIYKSEKWSLELQTAPSVPGDLTTIPGVHAARLAAPDRPAVEPFASLARTLKAGAEPVLLPVVSQGLRTSIFMDSNGSFFYHRVRIELYASLSEFLVVGGRAEERSRSARWDGLWGPGPLGLPGGPCALGPAPENRF